MESQGSTSRELLELQEAQKELQRRHELTQQRCARVAHKAKLHGTEALPRERPNVSLK